MNKNNCGFIVLCELAKIIVETTTFNNPIKLYEINFIKNKLKKIRQDQINSIHDIYDLNDINYNLDYKVFVNENNKLQIDIESCEEKFSIISK